MFKSLLSFMTLLILTSCGPTYVDYFPYHDNGAPKPQVAMLPIADHSQAQLSCNLSEELDRNIRFEIMDKGELYVLSAQEMQEPLARIGKADYFQCDAALAQQFCEADFAVILEIICHKCTPVKYGLSKLMVRTQIKIVDLRCRVPRIALQEIFDGEYSVCVEQGICAEKEPYYASSLAKAHRRYAADITERIQSVVLCSY